MKRNPRASVASGPAIVGLGLLLLSRLALGQAQPSSEMMAAAGLGVPSFEPESESSHLDAHPAALSSPISDPSLEGVERSDGDTYVASYLEPNTSRFQGQSIISIENCGPDCCRRRCLANEDCLSFTVDDTGLCNLVADLAPCAIFAANQTSGLIFDALNDVYPPPQKGVVVPSPLVTLSEVWTCRGYRGRDEGAAKCVADCVQAACEVCMYTKTAVPGRFDCACLGLDESQLALVNSADGVYLWARNPRGFRSAKMGGAPATAPAPAPAASPMAAGSAGAGGTPATATATTAAASTAAPVLEPSSLTHPDPDRREPEIVG